MYAFIISCIACTQLMGFDFDAFDQFAEKILKEEEVPGAAIAIVSSDRVHFLKGYGVADLKTERKVDSKTLFQLASVSKTFTSLGVGKLVQMKKVDWNRPAIQDFPSFSLSDIYAKCYATPKDLLAHRTGLPPFRGDLLGQLGYSNKEIVKRIEKISFETTFREKAQYSNIGYFLAGEFTAYISGMPWKQWIKAQLLDPLQMHQTGFDELFESPLLAMPYGKKEGKISLIQRNKDTHFQAAGGVISSAEDMAIWLKMLLGKGSVDNNVIISSEIIEEILTPAMAAKPDFTEAPPIPLSPFFCYSLGFGNYQYKQWLVIEKGGALEGVRTLIAFLPELNIGIVILCNLNLSLYPEIVRAKFLELLAGPAGIDVASSFSSLKEKISSLIDLPNKFEPDIKMPYPLSAYEGAFESPLYGNAFVKVVGDTLKIIIGPGGYEGRFEHYSNNTFLLRWPLVNLGISEAVFSMDGQGRANAIEIEGLGVFKQIDAIGKPSS